jgi:trehalose-6-phosphate synthase
MIKNILEMLQISEFIGCSKEIDIAKGVNKIPTSVKEVVEQTKRAKAWRKRQ